MLWVVAVGPLGGDSDDLSSAAVLAARVLQVLGSLPVVSVAAGAPAGRGGHRSGVPRRQAFPCYSCRSGCPAKALTPGLRGVTAGLGRPVAGRSRRPGGTWNPSWSCRPTWRWLRGPFMPPTDGC
jgi:hypothetical protein